MDWKVQSKHGTSCETLIWFSSCDLNLLKDKTASEGSLKQSVLGRFPLLCISATEFFIAASNLVNTTPFALIKQRMAYD